MELKTLYQIGYIDHLALAFAGLIERLNGKEDPWVTLAAALVSRAAAEGHVCLDLSRTADEGIPQAEGDARSAIGLSAGQWGTHLSGSPAVGLPGEFKPLILHRGRLYLHRFWQYESELAEVLQRRCHAPAGLDIDPQIREAELTRLFPDAPEQRAAARLVLTRPFSVISGGPGTGKTYTLAKIILLLAQVKGGRRLRVKIAAPTGKAAARLQESLQNSVQTLTAAAQAFPSYNVQAETVHRLLGIGPSGATPHYHPERLLPAEVVIVDEASMLDLALIVKLVRAIPERAHLVLSGDRDQLSSVEAGAVLGDICRGLIGEAAEHVLSPGGNGAAQPFPAPVALLCSSYRFNAQGGIGALSRAINSGDAAQVMEVLGRDHTGEIGFRPIATFKEAEALLESEILENYGTFKALSDPVEALTQLKRFKILTVVRKGPRGIEVLNRWIQDQLRRHGLIAPLGDATDWFAGRPVMITRNDYFHRLFNGDTGIAVAPADRSEAGLAVAFESPGGVVRRLKPHELPAHETVYAMTVHKSQGSEFERVILLLPDRDVPLLTRELIYTAVTRARRSVLIVGDPRLLEAAVKRRSERASGLREALAAAALS